MKHFQASLLLLALFVSGQAAALPVGHPADPGAAVPAFQPADYTAGYPGTVRLSADAHQHDAVPAARESGEEGGTAAHGGAQGEGCKRRGEGDCCCCKCCCMGSGGDDMMHMKKSGHGGGKEPGMMDCDMMKMKQKGMQQEGDMPAAEPGAQQDEGHEAHH